MIAAGFTLIGRGSWSGGESYLSNLLSSIASELRSKVQAKLFLEQHSSIGARFDLILAAPATVDDRAKGAGLGRRGLIALVQGIDIVFEVAQWFGNRFQVQSFAVRNSTAS
ncbi:MAG: hypothetical protein E5W94_01260 [Mesorhizobium sp.]|nr:MAG: hypothetical protein E5W94_01260 [Mesorhizobium sp.]